MPLNWISKNVNFVREDVKSRQAQRPITDPDIPVASDKDTYREQWNAVVFPTIYYNTARLMGEMEPMQNSVKDEDENSRPPTPA
ncbi:hypothetical protein PC119_g22079 [Phytophthora cactorum]|nr:hypothetical protein PC111_g11270 [Phytophthora cactorum]KAG2976817.1 hypothetical protein PC119_g22079 [Phytophthora cactorum]KAG3147149.1 hypothetical protein C6341_g17851 [Phytophthora cactorum]